MVITSTLALNVCPSLSVFFYTSCTSTLLDHLQQLLNLLPIAYIESAINTFRPDIVFIPNPSYNQDHQAVYDASIIALRPHD